MGGGEEKGIENRGAILVDKDEEEEKVHFKIEGITHPLLSLRDCHNYFLISAGRTVVDVINIRKERLATDYKDPVLFDNATSCAAL